MPLVRASAVWTPDGPRADATVEVTSGGTVLSVRPAVASDPPAARGILVPGLVNAHTHLELSATGLVTADHFTGWVRTLMKNRVVDRDEALKAARDMVRTGTAVVCDVGTSDTAGILMEAGLAGVEQVEFLTLDSNRIASRLAAMARCGADHGSVRVRPAVHALYSTALALVRAAVGHRSASPASLHIAESRDELAFLADGSGPMADLLADLGVDWQWWQPPGTSPVEALRDVLGPGLLLVHGVHTSEADRRSLARSGTPLCLCPRSNLHITGDLPDVPALIEAGVHLCLGTDSLASSPDLDVLGEIPVLASAFPEVPVARWLSMVHAGADALGFQAYGRIAPGSRPGLLLLEIDALEALREVPPRRWLLPPGGVHV